VGTLLVGGTANPALTARLADATGWDVAPSEVRRFPDGEVYARLLEDARGRDVAIVQSTHPNDNLVELLLLQDAAREVGARHITSIIPYFGYARQDRAFQSGEAVSSRAVARAIATTADRVVTVDPHKAEVLGFFADGGSVSAVPALAEQLGAWGVDCILAPDRGARDRAAAAAGQLGIACDHLEKTRLSATQVRMQAKELDVAGQRVAILDDMIASGSTMMTAAAQLKEQGATRVYAACTHGLFTDGAVARLRAAGIDRVLCTDTLETTGCDVVSAAPTIAAAWVAAPAARNKA
jgi:ribose-phosphate pyrophosphokinase